MKLISEHGYCNSEHDNEAVQDGFLILFFRFGRGCLMIPPHLQSLLGTSWIMSHRALPIHELLVFMRAMSHSLMALDASSFWCFWRRRADECFEASQVNAKLRALQEWQLQHVPTLDSRNRSHCLLMLCISLHHTHFNSKGLKREVADAWTCFCAKFVVPLQRGEMRWVVFGQRPGLAKTCTDVLLQCSYINMCHVTIIYWYGTN